MTPDEFAEGLAVYDQVSVQKDETSKLAAAIGDQIGVNSELVEGWVTSCKSNGTVDRLLDMAAVIRWRREVHEAQALLQFVLEMREGRYPIPAYLKGEDRLQAIEDEWTGLEQAIRQFLEKTPKSL